MFVFMLCVVSCCVACQMESQCAAHQLSLTKHHSQEASLQDSLAKTAALSQGLAMDKVELNRLLLQVSSSESVSR